MAETPLIEMVKSRLPPLRRGRGSGRAHSVHVPPRIRGASTDVAGINPFSVGSTYPAIGAPIGRGRAEFGSVATFHCDPISWFERAKLISVPSMFVLGLPGLGKSTLIRRMITWYFFTSTIVWVPGDVKPDYVNLIRAMGGQVFRLGTHEGSINALDMGDVKEAAKLLPPGPAAQLLSSAQGRRRKAVEALVTIQRGTAPEDHEESLLGQAMLILDRKWAQSRKRNLPVLSDLLALIQSAPQELRDIALDQGDLANYHRITNRLQSTLTALTLAGGLGDIFNKQSTHKLDRTRAAVIDISAIDESDEKARSAALVLGWALAFNQVEVSNALADAKVEPQRHYVIVQDELWMTLRQGLGMVDRVDALSRLDRNKGVGQIKCSHTMKDLEALAETDRAKARGFVERSGMVHLFGLPRSEMELLTAVVPLSGPEQTMLARNATPNTWSVDLAHNSRPPGQGLALCKVGERPGLPYEVVLTRRELALNDTNHRWAGATT
jgi:hypothetical protein